MAQLPNVSTYCLCSELSFGDMVERQRAEPLPFEAFLDTHTKCNDGCGGCVPKLEQLLGALGLLNSTDSECKVRTNSAASVGDHT